MDDALQVQMDSTQVDRALADLQTGLATGFEQALTATKQAVRDTTRKRFETGGNGAWPSVTAATLRGRRENPLNQPLIDTGDLMRSVTEPGAKDAIKEQTPFGLTLGTSRIDANRHEHGSQDGREPARPYLEMDADEMVEIIEIFAADLDSRISRLR